MDIGQGAGLASATGVRPFLPPLLAGALARGDIGLDFDNTDWSFLESPGFLLAVLGLAILSYGAERSGMDRRALRVRAPRSLGVVLGAMLFAGSLAEGDTVAWPGLIGGAARGPAGLRRGGGPAGARPRPPRRGRRRPAQRLRRRGGAGAGAIAIFVPPVSFLALIALAFLLVRGRQEGERKYAGLRILR